MVCFDKVDFSLTLTNVSIDLDLVPGKRSWQACLFKDTRSVKGKLNLLTLAGDREETKRWRHERLGIVFARRKVWEFLAGIVVAAHCKVSYRNHGVSPNTSRKLRKNAVLS